MKICSFFGHKELNITDELRNKLKSKIEELIVKESYDTFFFGGFGYFDDLCWQVVTELKQCYKQIRRIYCLSDRRHLRFSKRPKWLKDEDYEEFVYLELDFDFYYQRIYFRNIEMINQSDYVIFYVDYESGSGAYKALKYAKQKKKDYLNLGRI